MAGDTTTTGRPTGTQQGNGLAIAGLVCGIVGLFFLNVVLGPLAIIFGGIGWSKASNGARYRGMAIASVVLGVIDLVIFFVLLAVAANNGGSFSWHVG
jgi:hypothetical protein